jgi:hypothetical protein
MYQNTMEISIDNINGICEAGPQWDAVLFGSSINSNGHLKLAYNGI